jgi:cell division inhibitor SepF
VSGTAIKKFMNYFWGEEETADEYDEEYENTEYGYDYAEEEDEGANETLNIFKRKNKVVSMPQPQQIKMQISKPTNFEQANDIIAQLKNKNSVVINLEYVSKEVGRRIVDVVSGAVRALDGNMEKVSNSIFVIAPYNYDIENQFSKEKLDGKLSTSWMK